MAKPLRASPEQRRELLRHLLAEEFGAPVNESAPHPDDWLRVDDSLPLSPRTIRDAVKAGELEGYQPDRTTLLVRRRDLDAWIARHKVAPRSRKDRAPAEDAPALSPDVAALAGKLGMEKR